MDSAVTWNVANSGVAQIANQALVIFYYNTNCGVPACSQTQTTSGSGYLFSPNKTVFISAAGLYSVANSISGCIGGGTIQSILVTPKNNGTAILLGGSSTCFTINNGCGTSGTPNECTGTQTKAVTLTSPA